ncbi:YicC/YloC family endoribonuclease [Thalassobius sp. Cn5-15]|uniref:YicC/YloC family endoribonuclease n=1 Tax=Thalassobius sp. Cn5-15 TaxID=2917763 RepID=UPI001EF271B3|nr:YicC family protein [Thalassobius sp. Cn5-15]
MLQSMTGFASGKGALAPHSWTWELRSVNAKGLDLRLRVPDWIEGLETALRGQLGTALGRGNVTLSLRIQREETGSVQVLNASVLDSTLIALSQITARAAAQGVELAPMTAADLMAQRGVMEQASSEDETKALSAALLAEFPAILQAFTDMRATEGRALHQVLTRAVDEIETLTDQAEAAIGDRKVAMEDVLRSALTRVMQNVDTMDEDRLAQEMALIAVKSDVTEELDRLRAHIAAARDLLNVTKPVGRKLDFLMQEFNREANTLCSKSQNTALTRIGLDLKTVIDQMREQVQNVE